MSCRCRRTVSIDCFWCICELSESGQGRLVCRGSLMYFFSNAEGHLDEAVLRLNVKDCHVLSLQQDSVN